ncbi:hypothetical protein P389DRAFT_65986 [Cystobasidium minutum MCA 4210]|uniref:uncharacterized protein n=1 Tax=Cystobasidium minutum MCA 4210 TaxID=1397322 RepID=UPI0034CE51CD|eukprot:jgi/Rhomi1/65986/CE65985_1095
MALPYATSPPPSRPGTPLHGMSRPGTPSKASKTFSPIFSAFIKDASSSAVFEKHHHLSSARLNASIHSHVPAPLKPFKPYFTALHIPIPRTNKLLLIPIPSILLNSQSRSIPPPLTPRRAADGQYLHHQNRKPRPSLLGYLVLFLFFLVAILRIRSHSGRISIPFVPSSSNILNNDQIARVWQWEIGRGHYPSSRRLPTTVSLTGIPNPGVDARTWDIHTEYDTTKASGLPRGPLRFPSQFAGLDNIRPSGPARHYLNITNTEAQSHPPLPISHPPRPAPGSVIDLDIVMDHCDFTTGRYVRDCLEVLRAGAELDNSHRFRRGNMDQWKHIYVEDREPVPRSSASPRGALGPDGQDVMASLGYVQPDPHGLTPASARDHQKVFSLGTSPSNQHIEEALRPPLLEKRQNIVGFGKDAAPHPSHPTADPLCDPDYPKVFHIFWAGPFTDKPYLAVSSFLYTQNLGLQYKQGSEEMDKFLQSVCRPQLWIWINPGPAASLPNPRARKQMFDQLRENPWSSPFLHPRFSESVKFRLWNTTEQLDAIPEMRDHWRSLPLFNSGGVKYGAPSHTTEKDESDEESSEDADISPEAKEEELGRFGDDAKGSDAEHIDEALKVKGAGLNATAAPHVPQSKHAAKPAAKSKKTKDELLNRIGSTSSKDYDRLTVVLSDMARFVLTHRFGGIYLDADTIFLRDWEELWGWKGAFAYRWSRLEKYNTAVLKMQRNSALGSFLFKSALANGLDFHPMTISRYTKDASLEPLLLRLPDALFDSAWLNTEYYQRDRPAYPYFKRFEDLFDPPKEDSAAPPVVGFEGFYRGAFSYHFHNFWWIPFDPARNWPDLGPRFAAGEKKARAAALQARLASELSDNAKATENSQSRSPTKPPVHATPVAGQTKVTPDLQRTQHRTDRYANAEDIRIDDDDISDDAKDLSWATVLKRTFEQFLREERPNMYGEWIDF